MDVHALSHTSHSLYGGQKRRAKFFMARLLNISMAWKSIVNAAALKGKPKPLAPCCCKCTAAKRIAYQYECMCTKSKNSSLCMKDTSMNGHTGCGVDLRASHASTSPNLKFHHVSKMKSLQET